MPNSRSWKSMLEILCRTNVDRRESLQQLLQDLGLAYHQITTGPFQHYILFLDNWNASEKKWVQKAFTAHYDRVPGTPGANDNGASVIQLLLFAEKLQFEEDPNRPLIVFTDGEELGDQQTFKEQGAYYLGEALKRGNAAPLVFFVFDMCGIGTTPVWSLGYAREKEAWQKCLKENFLRFCGGHDLECPLLFSDNAGLSLAGWSSVLVSLLPNQEARNLNLAMQNNSTKLSRKEPLLTVGDWLKTLKQNIPPSWAAAHSLRDEPETIDDKSFLRMERMLRDLQQWQIPKEILYR